MTIEEMFDRFTVSKRALGASPATLKWYRTHVLAFADWHSAAGNPELTSDLMEAYIVHLRDRPQMVRKRRGGLAGASVASAHRALRAFFKWCVGKRLIDASPVDGVKIQRPDPTEPRRALRSEVEALIRGIPVDGWVGLRDYLIIHVMFYCGLRVGELVRLEEHHFELNPENPVLHIPAGKTGGGVVPLWRDVVEAFLAYQMHRPAGATERLFVSASAHHTPRGALSEAGVRQMLEKRCKEAGIRHLNPHAFRHGVAMHLLNDRGADASLVQRILRHANIRTTTTTYARWTVGALGNQYRALIDRG
jgi:integrase